MAVVLTVAAALGMAAFATGWLALGIAGYVLLYAFLGGGDALLAEVVHRRVRSDQRATVLSVQSLVQQLGGVGGGRPSSHRCGC